MVVVGLPTTRLYKNNSPPIMAVFCSKRGECTLGEAQTCKLYKRVAYAHTGHKEAIFTRLRCKQWSCEYCAKKNASIWRAHLKQRLPEISEEWYLVTFTAHSKTRSKQASLENLRGNLDILFKRVKRVFGCISYVRTFEKHPTSNALHAHYIVSGLAPFVALGCSSKLQPCAIGILSRPYRDGIWSLQTWFAETCFDVGIGYIVDVRMIEGDVERAIWYVTKYLTKEQQGINVKGLRHVQTTRDIGSPKGDKELEWHTASYIVSHTFAPNTKIEDLNTGRIIDNSYWEIHDVYPWDD